MASIIGRVVKNGDGAMPHKVCWSSQAVAPSSIVSPPFAPADN